MINEYALSTKHRDPGIQYPEDGIRKQKRLSVSRSKLAASTAKESARKVTEAVTKLYWAASEANIAGYIYIFYKIKCVVINNL